MVLEPVAAQVYFSPECHAAYAELGFSPSPGTTSAGVQLPDGPAYFTSRGSVMGQVSGAVVAAAFGVFNPEAVVPSVEFGWKKVDAATICDARTRGAVAQLERVLGPSPDGLARATALLKQLSTRYARKASLSMPACSAWGCRGSHSPTRGVSPTCCVNTAATPTSPPGRRPSSTPPRSGC